ncbi:MAG: Gfo/Idh/MocA family protein [Butyricicoccaceae bacterium]
MKKLRVGVIGIGDISNVYLNNLKKYDAVEVVACASRGLEKAQRKAAEHGIPKAYASGMELIADPDIDLVLNLTTPQATLPSTISPRSRPASMSHTEEAPRHDVRGGQRAGRAREGKGPAHRLRPGYLPRRPPSEHPRADRQRQARQGSRAAARGSSVTATSSIIRPPRSSISRAQARFTTWVRIM